MIDIAFLFAILPKLLSGLPLTLQLAAISITLGFFLALSLAFALQLKSPFLTLPIRGFVALFRGTPLLVQIFLIYYGLGQFRPGLQAVGLWGFFREPYWCAILALSQYSCIRQRNPARRNSVRAARISRCCACFGHAAFPDLAACHPADGFSAGDSELWQ